MSAMSHNPIYWLPAGGQRVELDESHNIVFIDPRFRDDVRVTITNVEALVDALRSIVAVRTLLQAEWHERAQTLPPIDADNLPPRRRR